MVYTFSFVKWCNKFKVEKWRESVINSADNISSHQKLWLCSVLSWLSSILFKVINQATYSALSPYFDASFFWFFGAILLQESSALCWQHLLIKALLFLLGHLAAHFEEWLYYSIGRRPPYRDTVPFSSRLLIALFHFQKWYIRASSVLFRYYLEEKHLPWQKA